MVDLWRDLAIFSSKLEIELKPCLGLLVMMPPFALSRLQVAYRGLFIGRPITMGPFLDIKYTEWAWRSQHIPKATRIIDNVLALLLMVFFMKDLHTDNHCIACAK
jgi:hypothetical protein